MEANWNLLLIWFSSQGFFKTAETNDILVNNQGGGQQGCSTIELACKKVISFDFICTTRTEAINIENDAKACFDLMAEACHSLSCLCYRADPAYIKLHTQTQCTTQYHIKYSHGISKDYNSYSINNLWYGAGQGATNAAICWIILSCCLIGAYLSQAHQWVMHHPNQTTALHQSIDAFINNTTLLLHWPCNQHMNSSNRHSITWHSGASYYVPVGGNWTHQNAVGLTSSRILKMTPMPNSTKIPHPFRSSLSQINTVSCMNSTSTIHKKQSVSSEYTLPWTEINTKN